MKGVGKCRNAFLLIISVYPAAFTDSLSITDVWGSSRNITALTDLTDLIGSLIHVNSFSWEIYRSPRHRKTFRASECRNTGGGNDVIGQALIPASAGFLPRYWCRNGQWLYPGWKTKCLGWGSNLQPWDYETHAYSRYRGPQPFVLLDRTILKQRVLLSHGSSSSNTVSVHSWKYKSKPNDIFNLNTSSMKMSAGQISHFSCSCRGRK